jgi:hypothetical protein
MVKNKNSLTIIKLKYFIENVRFLRSPTSGVERMNLKLSDVGEREGSLNPVLRFADNIFEPYKVVLELRGIAIFSV